MLSEIEQVLPSEIEKRSFEIITEELKEMGKILCPETELIVKRCIHTSADFEYADSLVFTEGVVEKAKDAIRRGVPIITDTQMGKAGINKKRLAEYGSEVLCLCRMKMWQRWRKRMAQQERWQVWIRQLHWEERLSLQLEMHRQHWYGFMS